MKILYSFVCGIFMILAASGQVNAQTPVTVGTGTSSGSTNVFVATSTTSNNYSYNFTIYSAADILAAGGYPGLITKLAWEKGGTGELSTPSEFTVYLKHVNYTQHTTTLETWSSIISNATMVYSNNAFVWPTGTGFKDITLSTPFLWNGSDNLAVLVDWHKNANPTTAITWLYTTATDANKWRIGSSPLTDMNQVNSSRANLQLTITPNGPCVAPPTPGIATASNTAPVCPGTAVNLNLNGSSYGSGQTYYWEASGTGLPGSYTAISTDIGTALLSVNPTVTTYYRAVVTCSAQSDTSAPVQVVVNQPLPAGTYTIDANATPSATTFVSFTEAINALNCGVAGPVVFEVAPSSGPYNEQIVIPEIPGASATNTITINGRGNTIQFNTSVSASRYVIRLDGADYVTLDSLVVAPVNTTYGWGIHILNQSDNVTITRSVIDLTGATSTSSANTGGIIVSNSNTAVTTAGNNANRLHIIDNTIIGGYRGIIINASAGAVDGIGHVISGNTIRDFYADGIVLDNTDSALVMNNDIHRANRPGVTSFVGIELAGDARRTTVMNNKIHDTHNSATTQSGSAYGLLSSTNDVTAGMENLFINNLIYNFNSTTGTIYGIYNNSSDGAWYYHNTISLDNASSTSGTTRGFYLNSSATSPATNIKFQNNIVSITRGGTGAKYLVYFGPGAGVISNNNDLYLNAPAGTTNAVGYFGTGFTDLTAWQGANSAAWDQQSVDYNPMFANAATGDFTPTNLLLDNLGANLGIATDINGTSRGATPDIGAFEFNTPLNVELVKIAAKNVDARNRVEWLTASEDRGDIFEVERSTDGKLFNKIGTVDANGTGSSYSYWDDSPVNGVNYYRLRMISESGRTSYSQVVSALVGAKDAFVLQAYPNPVKDVLKLSIAGTITGNAQITVSDITGKLLRSMSVVNNETSVDMSGLQAGTYIVKYTDDRNTKSVKVSKQ